nr:cupin domain-containing protein [Coralloluteibacterium stylophorae]
MPPLGMPAADFLRDYWQKKPLLIRSAFPDFVSPLAPEDLAGLACEDGVLARIISHDRRRDHYALRTGPFDEAEFPGLPDHDWTLLVQDVDKWDADVRALLPAFGFLPRWRVDDIMVSFAAPGGSVGAHVDQYDVFLLQAHGHRRWQIDARPNPPADFRDDVEIKLLRDFAPSHEWVLAPGDMLYLPPGVPHHGVAEDACLTFSIGMRAPSVAELMVDLAEHLAAQLPEETRYADPDLVPPTDPTEIDAAALERVRAALVGLRELPDAALRDWFGGFMTTYRSAGDIAAPPRPLRPADIERRLQAGGRLVRHPHARHAWARAGRGGVLYAHGDAFAMGTASARALAAADELDAAALARLDARGRAALEVLAARGHYAIAPARRRR